MPRIKPVFVIASLLAAFLAWQFVSTGKHAGAQNPTRLVRQKWEYATLAHDFHGSTYSDIVTWTAGKKIFKAEWGKDQPHPFAKLNKELGGGDDNIQATVVGVLLDRIGQDGWEMVSHARVWSGGASKLQTWTFKRPVE